MGEIIKLGSKVRDTISGFEGIATGRAEYLHATPDVLVSRSGLHDGKPIPGQWFDEARLEVVEPA